MEGGCFCGAIRYRTDGAPRRVSHCHCLHCRRSSGAAFLTWAEFHPSQVRFAGDTPGSHESRPGVTRQFCRRCGTPLTYRNAATPESLDVSACSLDAPEDLRPQDHLWVCRMLPWIRLADGLPRHDRDRE